MERWGESEPPHLTSMSEDEIKKKFQLLKKDASGNHNLLKSRSCERCIDTGKRGTPFGIKFWYEGSEDWPSVHQRSAEAEEGCIGCGWYNFNYLNLLKMVRSNCCFHFRLERIQIRYEYIPYTFC